MDEEEDLFVVLEKTNEKMGKPVDSELLKQVMALVKKNPLEEDRSRCQDQILAIIKEHGRDKK